MFRPLSFLRTYFFYKIKYRKELSFDISSTICMSSTFEGANRICGHSFYSGNMGYGSYLGDNTKLYANIGRFTSIAPGVECNIGFHPYTYPFATTSPFFYNSIRKKTFATQSIFIDVKKRIEIGNDCWIGQNSFLAGGIVIGDGAVILAGAYVVKDVPPYAIVGGVPAKIIKYRYDEDTIYKLLEIKWWNQPIKWLKKNWLLMSDVNELFLYYRNHEEEFKEKDLSF